MTYVSEMSEKLLRNISKMPQNVSKHPKNVSEMCQKQKQASCVSGGRIQAMTNAKSVEIRFPA